MSLLVDMNTFTFQSVNFKGKKQRVFYYLKSQRSKLNFKSKVRNKIIFLELQNHYSFDTVSTKRFMIKYAFYSFVWMRNGRNY